MIYYLIKQLILRHETMHPLPRKQCSASMKALLCNHNTTRIAYKENRPTLASRAVSVLLRNYLKVIFMHLFNDKTG